MHFDDSQSKARIDELIRKPRSAAAHEEFHNLQAEYKYKWVKKRCKKRFGYRYSEFPNDFFQDVNQDFWEHFQTKIGADFILPSKYTSFQSYFATMVDNFCTDEERKVSRKKTDLLDPHYQVICSQVHEGDDDEGDDGPTYNSVECLPDPKATDPGDMRVMDEFSQEYQRAVDKKLTPRERTVFPAIARDGEKAVAVAKKLNISPATVRVTYRNARKKLQEYLQDYKR